MKVLVYGAGVIGCYLTRVLCRAEKPDFPMLNWDALRGAMPDWETLHQQYENKEGAHHNGTQPKSV